MSSFEHHFSAAVLKNTSCGEYSYTVNSQSAHITKSCLGYSTSRKFWRILCPVAGHHKDLLQLILIKKKKSRILNMITLESNHSESSNMYLGFQDTGIQKIAIRKFPAL